jgi:GGDEF domain-containing protein
MATWPGRDRLFHVLSTPEPRCVLVADVWNLGAINYRYGPERGDILLVQVWQLICAAAAPSPVFRLGGDEFVAVLPSGTGAGIERVAATVESGLAAAVATALHGTEDPGSWPWWIAKDDSLDLSFEIPVGINFGSACGDGGVDLLELAYDDYYRARRSHRGQ